MPPTNLAFSAIQPSLPSLCPIADAIGAMAVAGVEGRGAFFTRREVVDFVLDLVGYTVEAPLLSQRLLEPSCGDGDFLLPAVDRLLAAWERAEVPTSALLPAIRAVELNQASLRATRIAVIARLVRARISESEARTIAEAWLIQGDYLLTDLDGGFDVVIGNPPYVRQELIPDVLMKEYRLRYRTIYDRADLYVPFIEASLRLLKAGGKLGFICADRWMKNRYGGPLRQLVAEHHHLQIYVDMTNTQAFHAEVDAYPAIFVIAQESGSVTRISREPDLSKEALTHLAQALTASSSPDHSQVTSLEGAAASSEPWILDASPGRALVRRIEGKFPTLEEAACKVGIGVATGADAAFIGPYAELDVESDRKLPLVMTRDIGGGSVAWRGQGVVNPFGNDGRLVDLAKYPRLKGYLEARRDEIAGRHVAQKVPANWYRTIDRIYPEIAVRPKLLIPDIKGDAHIVYEDKGLYPHHNLYFITSDEWDVRALQAVLQSGIARLFVGAYCTKMRGGFLRFQAQYLRRIRVPHWRDVDRASREALIAAAIAQDTAAAERVVAQLYDLSDAEFMALKG